MRLFSASRRFSCLCLAATYSPLLHTAAIIRRLRENTYPGLRIIAVICGVLGKRKIEPRIDSRQVMGTQRTQGGIMRFLRHAVLVAASVLAVIAVSPTLAKSDDQHPSGDNANDKNRNGKPHNNEERGNKDRGGQQGQQGHNPEKFGNPAFGQKQPNGQHKQFGSGAPGNNP
ncbi:MAG TPA: hypothetical protein VIF39_04510, partial [Hyphomicrobium sp.]